MSLATQAAINNLTAFENKFLTLAGTHKSFLENSSAISMEVIEGKQKMKDTVGKIAMQLADEVNSRVKQGTVNHYRRKLIAKRYNAAIQVDEKVVRDMGKDPKPAYAKALVDAVNREKDQVIYASLFADVATGELGETSLTFAQDLGRTLDATAGLTYEKIVDLQDMQSEYATGAIYDENSEFWMTNQEKAQLMKETKMISSDFSEIRKVNGKTVIETLGITLGEMPSGARDEKPVIEVADGKRNCFALAGTKENPAVYYSVRKNMSVKVLNNEHEFVEGRQVQATIEMGATRAWGERVIKVQTTPVIA